MSRKTSDEGHLSEDEIKQAVKAMSETLGIPELMPADDAPRIGPLDEAREAVLRLESLLDRPHTVSSLELVDLARRLSSGAGYATLQARSLLELASAWTTIERRTLRSVQQAHGQGPGIDAADAADG